MSTTAQFDYTAGSWVLPASTTSVNSEVTAVISDIRDNRQGAQTKLNNLVIRGSAVHEILQFLDDSSTLVRNAVQTALSLSNDHNTIHHLLQAEQAGSSGATETLQLISTSRCSLIKSYVQKTIGAGIKNECFHITHLTYERIADAIVPLGSRATAALLDIINGDKFHVEDKQAALTSLARIGQGLAYGEQCNILNSLGLPSLLPLEEKVTGIDPLRVSYHYARCCISSSAGNKAGIFLQHDSQQIALLTLGIAPQLHTDSLPYELRPDNLKESIYGQTEGSILNQEPLNHFLLTACWTISGIADLNMFDNLINHVGYTNVKNTDVNGTMCAISALCAIARAEYSRGQDMRTRVSRINRALNLASNRIQDHSSNFASTIHNALATLSSSI